MFVIRVQLKGKNVYSMDFAINRKYKKKYKVRSRSDWVR